MFVRDVYAQLIQLIAVSIFLTPIFLLAQPSYEDSFAKVERHETPTATISRQVERQLKMDAARLTLRANDFDLQNSNIDIPDSEQEKFYKLLRRVYQFDQRMLDCYHIKTANSPSTDYIRLIYKTNVAWAKPLESGISSTDDARFNELLTHYDLIIEKREVISANQSSISLRAVNPINMAALASQFYAVEGITAVDLGDKEFASSDIQFKQLNNAWEFHYILRPDETDNSTEHRWVFRIGEGGEVQMTNEIGDSLPTWVGCE